MIKLSEISYREEEWSEEIGDRYLVNMTFEDGAYTVAAYEKMGGKYGVPDTKLRYGDLNKAKKRYNDLIRKYRKMCESMKLRIKESEYNFTGASESEYFGIDIFDERCSTIVYSKDFDYIEKLYDRIWIYASEWFDEYGQWADDNGQHFVENCFDYIEENLYRDGYRDFKYELIKDRKRIGLDYATLKDGTKVEIVETLKLDFITFV